MVENYVEKLFGLKLKMDDELLKYDQRINESSKETVVTLNTTGIDTWLTSSFEEAYNVLLNPNNEYSSSLKNPAHQYKPFELEVVKVTRIVELAKEKSTDFIQIYPKVNNQPYQTYDENGNIDENGLTLNFKRILQGEIIAIDYNEKLFQLIGIDNKTSYQPYSSIKDNLFFVLKNDFFVKKNY